MESSNVWSFVLGFFTSKDVFEICPFYGMYQYFIPLLLTSILQ